MNRAEKKRYKKDLIRMIGEMNNPDFLFKIYHYAVVKYRKEKGGAV